MDLRFPKPEKRLKTPKRIERTCRPRRKRKGPLAAMRHEADRLWSLIVRAGQACESPRPHVCRGVYQGCHGFKRDYWNTRWLLINGFKMCQGEHKYFTHHTIEWDEHLRAAWGQPVYDELRALALRAQKPDVVEALAKLRAEAEQRGIA